MLIMANTMTPVTNKAHEAIFQPFFFCSPIASPPVYSPVCWRFHIYLIIISIANRYHPPMGEVSSHLWMVPIITDFSGDEYNFFNKLPFHLWLKQHRSQIAKNQRSADAGGSGRKPSFKEPQCPFLFQSGLYPFKKRISKSQKRHAGPCSRPFKKRLIQPQSAQYRP